MKLDHGTIRRLSSVSPSIYRDMDKTTHAEAVAQERINDPDNKVAISTALSVLTNRGLTYSFSPASPDKPRVEGKEMGWVMLLSIVDLLRQGVPTAKVKAMLRR